MVSSRSFVLTWPVVNAWTDAVPSSNDAQIYCCWFWVARKKFGGKTAGGQWKFYGSVLFTIQWQSGDHFLYIGSQESIVILALLITLRRFADLFVIHVFFTFRTTTNDTSKRFFLNSWLNGLTDLIAPMFAWCFTVFIWASKWLNFGLLIGALHSRHQAAFSSCFDCCNHDENFGIFIHSFRKERFSGLKRLMAAGLLSRFVLFKKTETTINGRAGIAASLYSNFIQTEFQYQPTLHHCLVSNKLFNEYFFKY